MPIVVRRALEDLEEDADDEEDESIFLDGVDEEDQINTESVNYNGARESAHLNRFLLTTD